MADIPTTLSTNTGFAVGVEEFESAGVGFGVDDGGSGFVGGEGVAD